MTIGWTIRYAAIIATILISAPASAGDFFKAKDAPNDIQFRGEIVSGDDKKLETVMKRSPFYRLALHSNGGDVETAIKMGRILRRERKFASVERGKYCRSACAFILVGAVERSVDGEVAIHRPYFANIDSDLTSSQIQVAYNDFMKRISGFIRDMNVPTNLADTMFSIPPAEMRVLSKEELGRFMLNQRDPVYDELITANEAATYRISSQEYRRRNTAADTQCDGLKFFEKYGENPKFAAKEIDACRVSVIAGLPIGIARERAALWMKLMYSDRTFDDFQKCQSTVILDGAKDCPDMATVKK